MQPDGLSYDVMIGLANVRCSGFTAGSRGTSCETDYQQIVHIVRLRTWLLVTRRLRSQRRSLFSSRSTGPPSSRPPLYQAPLPGSMVSARLAIAPIRSQRRSQAPRALLWAPTPLPVLNQSLQHSKTVGIPQGSID